MVVKKEKPQEKIPEQHPQITIFSDWCKSCGICVAFCPKEVLSMDENGRVFAKHPEKCIACHMCELRCPDFAINVEEAKPAETGEEKQ
ncbi:MAG: 4Fe-4S binding protein [Deltaproteobacteria bacterium]|nr:4Fe-4S binding protein [Candidatus Tharpella aukensis]